MNNNPSIAKGKDLVPEVDLSTVITGTSDESVSLSVTFLVGSVMV